MVKLVFGSGLGLTFSIYRQVGYSRRGCLENSHEEIVFLTFYFLFINKSGGQINQTYSLLKAVRPEIF